MKYSKNIIATILICGVVSTVAFAAAKAPLWTLVNESAVKQQTKKSKISYKSIFDDTSSSSF